MANIVTSQLSFFLLLLSFISGGPLMKVNGQKTWCIAKPSLEQATLLANINYACSQVDCQVIKKGCLCFNPNNLINHASVAMNLYYQYKGRNVWNCDFKGSGLIVKIQVMATAFTCNKREMMHGFKQYSMFPFGNYP